MAKNSLIDRLDQAIEAMLAQPGAMPAAADPTLKPFLGIAAMLRDLPRQEFQKQLKADLERSISMATTTENPIREDLQTLTLYVRVEQVLELAEFVTRAFDAHETFRGIGSAGGYHIEVRIGDSMMMLGGGLKWKGTPTPTAVHLYVSDADAVYQRALLAGATSLHPPVEQDYGDREASVKDPFGNFWYIATHKGENYLPPGFKAVTPFLHPKGAPQFIEFMKSAFGAEEVSRYESAGTVHHATVRIGGSLIEMGEAHGAHKPIPTMFYLRVDDADASYKRAIAAGARSLSEPADQAHGARMGSIRDPFGNEWHIATPVGNQSA